MSTKTFTRTVLAFIAAAALSLAGLVTPAAAAGGATVTVTITAPSGISRVGFVDLLEWSPEQKMWNWSQWGTVGEDGKIAFSDLTPGAEYTLAFAHSGLISDGYAPDQMLGGRPLDLLAKHANQVFTPRAGGQAVSFALVPGVVVKGKVMGPGGAAAGVQVGLYREDYLFDGGLRQRDGSTRVDEVETAADGSYTFPRVLPGQRYSVGVRGAGFGVGSSSLESVTLNNPYLVTSSAAARLITGATTLPTMTMRPSVPISGTVVAPAGAILEGTPVEVHEVDPAGRSAVVGQTLLDVDGKFSLPSGAFPGRRYVLRVYSPFATYTGLATSLADATPVTATASGLTFSDMPVIVSSGLDQTPWVWPEFAAFRGAPVVGATIGIYRGASPGSAASVPGGTVSYQWWRDGELIPGATKPEYTITKDDLHKYLQVRMVARAPGHVTRSQEFPAVLVETGGAPYATSHPVVSGSAKVGGKLSVSRGSWSVSSVGLAYQWLRDGQPVVGATGASYVLKAADRGKRLSVRITASAPGRANGVSVTAPSAKVAKGDAAKVKKKPKVTGTKRVGKKLKVSKGTWSLKGVKVSYQWLRNGKKISKATKRTYKLKKKDLGKRISVRVTVKKAGYKNAKFVTKKTSKIKAKKKR